MKAELKITLDDDNKMIIEVIGSDQVLAATMLTAMSISDKIKELFIAAAFYYSSENDIDADEIYELTRNVIDGRKKR